MAYGCDRNCSICCCRKMWRFLSACKSKTQNCYYTAEHAHDITIIISKKWNWKFTAHWVMFTEGGLTGVGDLFTSVYKTLE